MKHYEAKMGQGFQWSIKKNIYSERQEGAEVMKDVHSLKYIIWLAFCAGHYFLLRHKYIAKRFWLGGLIFQAT